MASCPLPTPPTPSPDVARAALPYPVAKGALSPTTIVAADPFSATATTTDADVSADTPTMFYSATHGLLRTALAYSYLLCAMFSAASLLWSLFFVTPDQAVLLPINSWAASVFHGTWASFHATQLCFWLGMGLMELLFEDEASQQIMSELAMRVSCSTGVITVILRIAQSNCVRPGIYHGVGVVGFFHAIAFVFQERLSNDESQLQQVISSVMLDAKARCDRAQEARRALHLKEEQRWRHGLASIAELASGCRHLLETLYSGPPQRIPAGTGVLMPGVLYTSILDSFEYLEDYAEDLKQAEHDLGAHPQAKILVDLSESVQLLADAMSMRFAAKNVELLLRYPFETIATRGPSGLRSNYEVYVEKHAVDVLLGRMLVAMLDVAAPNDTVVCRLTTDETPVDTIFVTFMLSFKSCDRYSSPPPYPAVDERGSERTPIDISFVNYIPVPLGWSVTSTTDDCGRDVMVLNFEAPSGSSPGHAYGDADKIARAGHLEMLQDCIYSLRGLKISLFARSDSLFGESLTSCMMNWGCEVRYTATESHRPWSGQSQPTPSVLLDPTADSYFSETEDAASSPNRRDMATITLNDDNLDVLRAELTRIRREVLSSLTPEAAYQRQVWKLFNPGQAEPEDPAMTMLVHFTTIDRVGAARNVIREVVQSTPLPRDAPSMFARQPRVFLLTKPMGPRRFLELLNYAMRHMTVDPSGICLPLVGDDRTYWSLYNGSYTGESKAGTPMDEEPFPDVPRHAVRRLHSQSLANTVTSSVMHSSLVFDEAGKPNAGSARAHDSPAHELPSDVFTDTGSVTSTPAQSAFPFSPRVPTAHGPGHGASAQYERARGILSARGAAGPAASSRAPALRRRSSALSSTRPTIDLLKVATARSRTNSNSSDTPPNLDATRPALRRRNTSDVSLGDPAHHARSPTLPSMRRPSLSRQASVPGFPRAEGREEHSAPFPRRTCSAGVANGDTVLRRRRSVNRLYAAEPLHPTVPEAIVDADALSESGASATTIKVPPITVLVVEDNPINMMILCQWLKKKSIKYFTAVNGRKAIEIWAANTIDVIIMDLKMPDMDGVEATQEIRRRERQRVEQRDPAAAAPFLPVIIVALTASSLDCEREKAIAAGCNDFVPKPLDLNTLDAKLSEWACFHALSDVSWSRRDSASPISR